MLANCGLFEVIIVTLCPNSAKYSTMLLRLGILSKKGSLRMRRILYILPSA
jgi:hypothetical protein